MIVTGLDVSLTSTGISTLCQGTGTLVSTTSCVRSAGTNKDTLLQRQERLDRLAFKIVYAVNQEKPDLVVIEAGSFGSKNGHAHDRSGLWWLVVFSLLSAGQKVLEVSPSQRMTYATGKGQIDKDQVLAAAVKRYPTVDITNNDVADATILAAIGMRLAGHPVEDPNWGPQTHVRALAKLALP